MRKTLLTLISTLFCTIIFAQTNCIPNGNLCICPFIYAPVCGCDGVMYNNSCLANCQGVAHTPAVPNGLGGYKPCPPPAPAASWNCVNGVCIDPGNGNGFYSSLALCVSSCEPPSIPGCTDSLACNYDSLATVNDSS